MFKKISKLFLDPSPLRSFVINKILKYKLGSFEQRVRMGAMLYSHYAYPLYYGARLAKKLGHARISTIEFGVAGGNGLVALEQLSQEIEKEVGVKIEVYGFDLSKGLPATTDYRDAIYFWKPGFFKMDVKKLQQRLIKAQLVLGDIKDTIKTFTENHNPAPIAAIMFDLDYYSSTKNAFEIFQIPEKYLLPRIFLYFDDIMGSEECLIGDFTGQRLAINEFNIENKNRKIDKLHFLTTRKLANDKYHRLRVFHHFGHFSYNTFVGPDNQQQQLF